MTDQERTRWTKLVADYEASELTQREFATERGISFSNLRNWIYRLRKESRPLVPEPTKVSGQDPERGAAVAGSRLLSGPRLSSRHRRRAAVDGSASSHRTPPQRGAVPELERPRTGARHHLTFVHFAAGRRRQKDSTSSWW
jgi:transposase-like protein